MVVKSKPSRATPRKARKRKVATEEAVETFYVAGSNHQQPRIFFDFEQVTECLSQQRDGFFSSFEKVGDAIAKVTDLGVAGQIEDQLKTQGVADFLKEQLKAKELELQGCKIELYQKIVELDEVNKSTVEGLKTELKRKEEELGKAKKEISLLATANVNFDTCPAVSEMLESDLSSLWTPNTDSDFSTEASSGVGFSTNEESTEAPSVVRI